MRLSRKYRLRGSSILFVGVTAFLGLGAIQTDPNLMPLVFGVALSVVLVSGAVGGGMLMGLRPRRLTSGPAQVGVTHRVRYEVRSRSRFLPSFALRIAERRSPRGERGRGWERCFSTKGGAGRAFVAQVGPGERVRAVGRFEPVRRGVVEFTGVEIASGFPFGLFHKVVTNHQPARVTVRPRVHHLRPGAVPQLMSRLGRESQSSRRKRSGDEFFALREYVPGDSPRMIAWRTSAQAGGLVVRENAERTSRRVRLVLFASPRAGGPDVERAVELFGTIATGLARTDVALHAEIPQSGAHFDAARPSALGAVLDALASFDHDGPPPGPITTGRDALIVVRTDEAAMLPALPQGAIVYTSADLERLVIPERAGGGGEAA